MRRARRAGSKLLEVLPKGLDKFFFTTSGTEANEAAIKIARMYTGKHKIIARYTSYHGSTAGLGRRDRRFPSLVRRAAPARSPASSSAPEVNCYRCPLKTDATPSAASPAPTTSRT